jgi:3-oxoacyl-[acyl-carrier-protein] synthase III
MKLKFYNKKITGIISILPKNKVYFKNEINNYNFSKKQSLKLAKIMGYSARRVVNEKTSVSDLCVFGLNYLFKNKLLKRDKIDALVLITQSPDYFLPPTSNVISGKINLRSDVICLDINQGCAGYEVGLIQAFMLLEQKNISKVIVLNADVLSKKVSIKDRNSRPLIGDGATITIVEKSKANEEINAYIKMDGKKYDSLIIPAGGFKQQSNSNTKKLKKDKFGNSRSLENLLMKGDDIFNFVITKVPEMLKTIYKDLKINKKYFDYYFFHQPNKFILEKLANKIEIPNSKLPSNIVENFGNGSGITVPLNICFNLGNKATKKKYKVCLGGFGVGLTWSIIVCNIKKLSFCKIIEFKK